MAAYTKAEAIARVQQGLGFRSDKATEILRALRDAQTLLEQGQTMPWWLLAPGQTLVGTADVATVTLPPEFLRFDDEAAIVYSDASLTPASYEVELYDYADWAALGRDPTTGTPESGHGRRLALVGKTLYVGPTPTVAFTLTASWYEAAADLADVGDGDSNAWLTNGPMILIGLAGAAVAADLEYPAAVSKFEEMYQVANARMIADEEARKGRSYRVGAGL